MSDEHYSDLLDEIEIALKTLHGAATKRMALEPKFSVAAQEIAGARRRLEGAREAIFGKQDKRAKGAE